MSYQVIARKWRPQNFLELVGQEHVSQTLLNALKSGRLPQALLFTGTRGVGKTSSARIFAKSLRCPNAKDFIPCNTCDVCSEITNGSSIDVMEIDGASNNGVDAIRELRDSVAYMPAKGKHKVYIVDEVHMLSNSAFNALLKTLEEPPAHVVFVLATTEPQKIPATILSRCQRYDFKKISSKNIANHLKKICEAEKIDAEAQALWLIARQADGSLRDALSFLDLAISFSQDGLKASQLQEVLGLTDRNLLFDTLNALVLRDKAAILKVVERLQQTSLEPKVFADSLLEELRNLLILKVGDNQTKDLVDLSEEELQTALDLCAKLSEEEIHFLFDMALKGANDIPRAQDPKIVLEMILLRMASAPKLEMLFYRDGPEQSEQERNQLSNHQNGRAGNAPIASASVGASTSNSTSAGTKNSPKKTEKKSLENVKPQTTAPKKIYDVKNVSKDWPQWVKEIQEKDALLAAKLVHVAPLSLKANRLCLGIAKEHEFLLEQLKNEIQHLQNYIFAITNVKIELQFVILSNEEILTPKKVETLKKREHEEEIRKKIESDPLFMATTSLFKSKGHTIKELK